jgi:hypothetical protein
VIYLREAIVGSTGPGSIQNLQMEIMYAEMSTAKYRYMEKVSRKKMGKAGANMKGLLEREEMLLEAGR